MTPDSAPSPLPPTPFRHSYFGRLFLAFAALVAASALVIGAVIHARLAQQSLAEIERNLANTALVLASAEGANPMHLWSEELPAQVREIGRDTGYHLRLVHANGDVAADSLLDPAILPNHRLLPAYAEARRHAAATHQATHPADQGPALYHVRPIFVSADIVGYVQLGASLAPYHAQLLQLRWRIAAAVIVNAALALLLGFAVGRHATRPLAQIAKACQRIAAGNLEAQVQLNRRDEFGVVAAVINRMADRLKSQIFTITHDREKLDLALERNRRLETVRQTFATNVSHELKTPLTAISSMVETLIADGSMDEQSRDNFHHRIHAQAERLKRLVADLLALSRLENAQTPGVLRPLDLRAAADEAAQSFAPVAQAKGLRLHAKLPPASIPILGDPESLRMLLNNLLQNAVAYTPAGGTVRVGLATNDQGEAELSVFDTGIGIAPEHQTRVFERFYRADRARCRNAGGTGLGLAIVKHIALSHRGRISLQSAPHQGSTFLFTLPLHPSPSCSCS